MKAAASTFACPPSLWRAVADRSRLAWPPRSPPDVEAFAGALERQRLVALAAHDAGLPADVREAAARRHAAGTRESRIEREQDEALSEFVDGFPFDWIAVNGADYRTRIYPTPAMRPMADVDILVRPDDLPGASRWLVARGYAPLPRHRASIDHGFGRPGCEHWVDLYDAFVQRQRTDVDYEELWRERVIGADRLPRLAPHHALAVHGLRLGNEQYVSSLRRFVDLWLLSRDEAVARRAIDAARRWRVSRAMFATMCVLRRLMPETAADAWHADADALVDEAGRRRLERAVLRGAPFETLPTRPVQIWRKLLLLDTPAHRLRFLSAQVAERALGRAHSAG